MLLSYVWRVLFLTGKNVYWFIYLKICASQSPNLETLLGFCTLLLSLQIRISFITSI
jgi:hypothetical protein